VDVLRLRNSRPQASAVFVTVLDAFAPGTQRPLPEVVRQGKTFTLKLSTPGLHWTLRIQPGRKNPADSIIVERTSSVSS
jgi:hypothetical protein